MFTAISKTAVGGRKHTHHVSCCISSSNDDVNGIKATAYLHTVVCHPPCVVPIRLTEENFVGELPTMLLTYDLDNLHVGPQSVADFEIPQGYSHKDCARNVGGFPYIHAFHYYLRF